MNISDIQVLDILDAMSSADAAGWGGKAGQFSGKRETHEKKYG